MTLANDYVDSLQPWLTADLETYARAIASMFSEVEALTGMDDPANEDSYIHLLDPDLAPPQALAWLAQWVGERLPVGISVPAQREYIKDHPNTRRGTAESIFLAAQRTLTGTRLVSLREKTNLAGGADIDRITVRTITSQTPNPTAVYNDLRKNIVPADIVLDYATVVGQTWQDVKDNNATWTVVKTNNTDWNKVYTTLSGSTVYTRPAP